MARNFEDYYPPVKEDGLVTAKPVTLTSTLNVTGATTLSTLNATGAITGAQTKTVVQSALVGATVVLTAAQSGGVFVNRSTSGTPSWTLPTAANGLVFTFETANTTAGFTVTHATATIRAKTTATGTAITTTTTLTNTQGTAVVGDAITIVCDGTNWFMTSQTGVFAAS